MHLLNWSELLRGPIWQKVGLDMCRICNCIIHSKTRKKYLAYTFLAKRFYVWCNSMCIIFKDTVVHVAYVTGGHMLTLCIGETPKRVILQTVRTQMKSSIMLLFIRVYTVFKVKKIFRRKNTKISFKL